MDDLERLPFEDVNAVLRSLKSNINLPNIVFLVLADKKNLLAATANFTGDETAIPISAARVYIEKILQYQFDIPDVPKTDLMHFFIQNLKCVLDNLGVSYEDYNLNTDNGEMYETAYSYITNLRNAKILSNSVWEALAYIRNIKEKQTIDVHLGDLIALTAIRLIDPTFYSNIPAFMSKCLSDWNYRLYDDNWGFKEKELEDWLTLNTENEQPEVIRQFLAKRLGLELSQSKSGINVYRLEGLQGKRQEYLSNYRLASPDCYREYFFDYSAVRYIGKDVMYRFVDLIKRNESTLLIFTEVRDSSLMPDLLRSLEGINVFSTEDETICYFTNLLELAGLRFTQKEYQFSGLDGFPDTIYTAIWRCIMHYCSKCVKPYDGMQMTKNVVGNIAYAGRLLYSAIESTPEVHLIWRFLQSEHTSYEQKRRAVNLGHFEVVTSLFDVTQYEGLEKICIKALETKKIREEFFDDLEFWDLMRAWNICLRGVGKAEDYDNMRRLISNDISDLAKVTALFPFISVSEVKLWDVIMIDDVKFLPIDIEGALRLFGTDLVIGMANTLSKNLKDLNKGQLIKYLALKFVIENRFSSEICTNKAQEEFVRSEMNKEANLDGK